MPKAQPLEYNAALPSFLQRLKAGHTALDGRNNVQIPRARAGMGRNDRLNMKGEEGDDDPVMLDESGNEVSKEEMKALEEEGSKGVGGDDDQNQGPGENGEEDLTKKKLEDVAHDNLDQAKRKEMKEEKVSSGFGKKRKAVKVIGSHEGTEIDNASDHQNDDADGNSVKEDHRIKSLKDSTKDLQSVVAQGKEDAIASKKEDQSSLKKVKRKKIKLSFDQPE